MTTYAKYPYAIGTEALKLDPLPADPTADPVGSICYTTGGHFRGKNASGWVDLDAQGGTGGPPSGSAGGDLTGSYPNPQVTATAKSKWSENAGILTPATASTQIVMVGSAVKATFAASQTPDNTLAINSPWGPQDTTKSSWQLTMNAAPGTDQTVLYHRLANAAAGACTTPFYVRSDDKTVCTLADLTVTKSMLAVNAAWRNYDTAVIPTNKVISGGAGWIQVASKAMAVSGGFVIVFLDMAMTWGVAASQSGTAGFGCQVDGAWATLWQWTRGSQTVGDNLPLPSMVWPTQQPAGTRTFSLWAYCDVGNVVTPANYPGYMMMLEIS